MFKVRDKQICNRHSSRYGTTPNYVPYRPNYFCKCAVGIENISFPSMDVLKKGKFKFALQPLKLKRNDSQAITSNVWCLIIVDIDKGVNRLACPADDTLYLLSLSASFNDTLLAIKSKLDQTLEAQLLCVKYKTLGSNLLDSYLLLRNIGNLEEKSIAYLYIMIYNILIEAPINIVDIHLNDIIRKIKYFLCCGQLYF